MLQEMIGEGGGGEEGGRRIDRPGTLDSTRLDSTRPAPCPIPDAMERKQGDGVCAGAGGT
jgi:hypothetical protein